jgi:Domain of unknown function (DUF4383)
MFDWRRMDTEKRYAFILGIFYLAVGLLAFIPPMTPNGYFLGIFAENAAHNWIHIFVGLLGLWSASAITSFRGGLRYAWFVLVFFGIITLLGFAFVPHGGSLLGFIRINPADNVVHLLVMFSGLLMVVLGQRRPVFRV